MESASQPIGVACREKVTSAFKNVNVNEQFEECARCRWHVDRASPAWGSSGDHKGLGRDRVTEPVTAEGDTRVPSKVAQLANVCS